MLTSAGRHASFHQHVEGTEVALKRIFTAELTPSNNRRSVRKNVYIICCRNRPAVKYFTSFSKAPSAALPIDSVILVSSGPHSRCGRAREDT
jgi:hypothetical protein